MALIVIEVVMRLQRDAVEERAHVLQAGDRDADLADLALRQRMIGVVAHLRRQVEGDREAGRAVFQQVAVALVRLLGGGVARVLAHRPEAAAIHRRLDAARVGILAGIAQRLVGVPAGEARLRRAGANRATPALVVNACSRSPRFAAAGL